MIDKGHPVRVSDLGGGVLHIVVTTTQKWVFHALNRTAPQDGYINITFFPENDKHDEPVDEHISLWEGFYPSDYVYTTTQDRYLITIVAVPKHRILQAKRFL